LRPYYGRAGRYGRDQPLSGFLITGLLLAEARRSGSVSLLEFYLRRARRILRRARHAVGARRPRGGRRSCPVVIGHTIAWIDDNHLSSAYSAELGEAFRGAFRRAAIAASASTP
jgi:hypothetical protein